MRYLFLLLLGGCVYMPSAPDSGMPPQNVDIQLCILASCADEGATNTPTRTIGLPEKLETPPPEDY